jgi:hypothetical protein
MKNPDSIENTDETGATPKFEQPAIGIPQFVVTNTEEDIRI